MRMDLMNEKVKQLMENGMSRATAYRHAGPCKRTRNKLVQQFIDQGFSPSYSYYKARVLKLTQPRISKITGAQAHRIGRKIDSPDVQFFLEQGYSLQWARAKARKLLACKTGKKNK